MKTRIISAVAAIAAIVCVALLLVAAVAYPMHLGEPTYYHACRVDCLVGATACGLVAVVAAVLATVVSHN